MDEANSNDDVIEVLVISAQNGKGMLFPKGGWEHDESMEEAAVRETLEEAGVVGNIERKLGKWSYESKRRSTLHEGHMFPMLVKQELDLWPEKNSGQGNGYVTISKAKEECPHLWMREALEELVSRQHAQAGQRIMRKWIEQVASDEYIFWICEIYIQPCVTSGLHKPFAFSIPRYAVAKISTESMLKMHVRKEVLLKVGKLDLGTDII
ncbi:Nudix hydrolase 17 [Hibiscus syriacus]|uniref:Nudix hydrolase 17 n=1 Tax=Hibiscus syriacus TaxID=106335 RepID=A0A6A2WSS7_HIBSY|nr:Nudix hydrolase 17 [Hibiscus syriacus]